MTTVTTVTTVIAATTVKTVTTVTTVTTIGTLRSDDGDGNGNAIKAIGLISKTTILHAFLYISLPVTARLRRENA